MSIPPLPRPYANRSLEEKLSILKLAYVQARITLEEFEQRVTEALEDDRKTDTLENDLRMLTPTPIKPARPTRQDGYVEPPLRACCGRGPCMARPGCMAEGVNFARGVGTVG